MIPAPHIVISLKIIRKHVVTIDQEDESWHQTDVSKVTLVRDDRKHFDKDHEVIEAENNTVKQILNQLQYHQSSHKAKAQT